MPAGPSTAEKPCFVARCCAELKRLAVIAATIGLVVLAARYYFAERLNEDIRARIEAQLRSHYQGLTVRVRSARRIAGVGVEVRGIRIAEAGDPRAPVIAEIEELLARCDTRPPNFLTAEPQITAIEIHRLKLRAERKPSGRWNVAHLLPLPHCRSSIPPVATIHDATLEILDPSQFAESSSSGLMLRNIQASVLPEKLAEGTILKVHGTLGGDHLDNLEIDGTLDPASGHWDLRGAVAGLEFSPRLRAALPREIGEALRPLASIRGRTYFGFRAKVGEGGPAGPEVRLGAAVPVQGAAERSPPTIQFVIHGKIAEGRIDDARLPEPLSDVEATIRCDNHGILIDELTARCGQSQIALRATLAGWSSRDPIDIAITARRLELARLPWSAFPLRLRQCWDQFQPHGIADVSGNLRFDGRQWLPDLQIDCHNLALCYTRFPYRLTDGSGTILLKPDWLTVRLKLMAGGGQPISCEADVQNPGPDYHGAVRVTSEGPLNIDERLLDGLDPAMRQVVRAFRPRGAAAFAARFERQPGEPRPTRHLTVALHDCSIQHEKFAYPIDHVSGKLILDDNDWRFVDLTGANDSAEIRGWGAWRTDGDSRGLTLQFDARDVPLADELRQALSPSAQQLWSQLQPRGNLDRLSVGLGYDTKSRRWSVAIQAEKEAAASGGRTISLKPAWFAYDLNNVTGAFRYDDGHMELINLRAEHGKAAIAAAGRCDIDAGGGWRLQLNRLAATRLVVDHELRSALPAHLAAALSGVPVEGPLGVRGSLDVLAPPQSDAALQLAWDLELDIENGRLLAATPVEHIHGGLRLTGRQSNEGVFARGELTVDSAVVRGVQLTSIQGPFWFDGRRLVFGALADRDIADRNGQQRAPRQITARTVGGLLSLDGEMALTSERPFDLRATLANAELAEIAQQLAPHQQQLRGKAFALVHVRGTGAGQHTWHGDGQISLREADLYELPVMIALLKLLSVQRPNATAFTNCNIVLRIEGDDLAFDRIDFSGDAISLKGKGRMTGQRQIDLKFYPIVGREERQLPFLRPLIGQTSQEFMLIEVTGTLDQPNISRTPFPRLDAQLAQLFPELALDAPIESNVGPLKATRAALNNLMPSSWR